MADTLKKPDPITENKPVKKVEKSPGLAPKRNIGLIELMMLLMLVGLVFVFVFPMQQMKVDKAQEKIVQQKVEAIVPSFAVIQQKIEEFVNAPANEFKDYPFDLSQLNIGTVNTPEFTFSWDETNRKIVATSTKAYGKEGIKLNYSIEDKIFEIDDPKPADKPVIKDEWLPEE
ncbi:MAG TPA: hypothetical protein P5533_02960 [Candidatus Cloacimonadota bacterium]|nr:hypothetical protein [Candidatus Cloacimonadota bacterium]